MALLNKLKSLFGLDDGESDSDRQRTDDVGVTVEHEPETTDEETPPATPAPGAETATPEPAEEDLESTDGPDIDPEVESPPTEEPPEESTEELDGRGETAESEPEPASGPAVDTEADESNAEPDVEPETDVSPESDLEGEPAKTESATAEPAGGETPVREIKGIGPSYATKLSEAGIDSASDLAAADAEVLSSSTGLSEKRIQGWIDRAETR